MILVTINKKQELVFSYDLGHTFSSVKVDLDNTDTKQRDLQLTAALASILTAYDYESR